tara:strand:+ start:1292 stop:1414 length:123 start_codon:yes stop_codon:yes gene_type:complete
MQAVFAGLLAWSIETGVALLGLYLLKREETKVVEGRNSDD